MAGRQLGFWDVEDRLRELSAQGDPLEKLAVTVDFEMFRVDLAAALERLITGEQLTCRQRDIDRFGCIVGQCSLADGQDIAASMIASGTATEYCWYSSNHYGTC
jgi:hypothetical protein